MQTKAESYKFFASSLVSLDDELTNILAIGSDRDIALRKGFSSFFPISKQLCCKGHLERDIRRKMRDLGIGLLHEKLFLEDIFGSEARKELGLVDAASCDEFDAVLESFYPVWTQHELEARQLSSEDSTQFYSYFLNYIAEDMKSMMIASVRKKTGFDDSFFYNNDPESMNNCIKTRMEKKKLSWSECVQQLKGMSEEQERNINRALIHEGPYRIRPECQRLIIPVEKWLALSKEQKERKLKEFQKIPLSQAFGASTSATMSFFPSILEAATEGMPSSSGKKPGQSARRGGRRSLSSPRDITGFRPRITVTEEQSSGTRDTTGFQPRVAASDLQLPEPTDGNGFKPKITANEVQTSERQYTCTWIKETKAYMCYGCEYPLRPKPTCQPCIF